MKRAVIRSGLETLYYTGAHRALRSFLGGAGAIITLHHVRPSRPDAFQPNRLLEVTPSFLEEVILRLEESGVELVSLDEMHRRLIEGDLKRRFVCFTFDDGYRDNLTWAYPILKKHRVPFAIYVPTSFPEGQGDLWWLTLEQIIAGSDRVEAEIGGAVRAWDCRTTPEKYQAFDGLYWSLRALPDEGEMRGIIRELAQRCGVNADANCEHLCMTWDELAELAKDPLVTIGAHTVNHIMLRKARGETAREEMLMSVAAIRKKLGVRAEHFSYPVGDASSAGPREFRMAEELEFKTAVTTRPGVLFRQHREHLTALPRISLNGEFQRLRYFDVLVSGAATALWNGFKRVDAA